MNKAVVAPSNISFLDALVEAIKRASTYNKNDQIPPAVVLWTDKERQWEALLPLLREQLPLLTLGSYNPAELTGPAYWLRAVLAYALPDVHLSRDMSPVIYLPGVSKQEIRAVEDCPKPLRPLAELQYRGILWTQKNGRDWTIAAFLQALDTGLGIEVGADNATREALQRALLKLISEPVTRLKKEAPLRAAFFDVLLNPDEVRNVLLWLDDPIGYRKQVDKAAWAAFGDLCQRKYGFHPEKDGPVTAAGLLGQRQGAWDMVWRRFTEAPLAYPYLPDLLRRARPQEALQLFGFPESWPQENEAAEKLLQQRLAALREQLPDAARQDIALLEKEHGPRRAWVWAAFGGAPLARALQHLAKLAKATEHALGGVTVAEIATAYREWGWEIDEAVLDTLACVEQSEDVVAVQAGIIALYRPWLEKAAVALQHAVAAGDLSHTYPEHPLAVPEEGTCVLFCDSLRFDAGQRLVAVLEKRGMTCAVATHLAALPTITPTAKPAISPVAEMLTGGAGLEPTAKTSGTKVTIEVLRKFLVDAGYQVLKSNEVGDPSGRAWTESGSIDVYGHQDGWKLAHHLQSEIRGLEQRISALLNGGWKQIVVVTDHGWLLLPGGLPKAELPEHLTVVRKGRCARLKDAAHADQQTVPWHWDRNVLIALAPGIHCYEAGKEYEHGGLSPQECMVPVITVSQQATLLQAPTIDNVTWRGLRCSAKVAGVTPGMLVDLRTKAGDPATSLIAAPMPPHPDGTVSLLVQDEDHQGEAAFLVVVATNGTVSIQFLTTVGG